MAAAGGIVSHAHGVDSEVGTLRTVLVHRPGAELKKMTLRCRERLLFDTMPWLSRAQQEHDAFTSALRGHGVEVLYLTELLQDALEYETARADAIGSVLADPALGEELRALVHDHLEALSPEALAQSLIAGLSPAEFRTGRGVVFELLDRHDFIIEPLPNLVFTRDSSFWIGDRMAVASLAAPARRREPELLSVIYRHHPRFAGARSLYQPGPEQVHGGDVLLLAPGVLAVGVGQRTGPAGLERLCRHAFDAGLAHTVLAVPIDQRSQAAHLDTICTVLDTGTVLMHPAVAYTLAAHTILPRPDGMRVSRPRPFLEAAAQALGIDRLRLIDAGLDPVSGPREQGDEGHNALVIAPGLAVCHERNAETICLLEAAGLTVIAVPGSELASRCGGPRGMACPVGRDPAATAPAGPDPFHHAEPIRALFRAVAEAGAAGAHPDADVPAAPEPVPLPAAAAAGWPAVTRRGDLAAGQHRSSAEQQDGSSHELAQAG